MTYALFSISVFLICALFVGIEINRSLKRGFAKTLISFATLIASIVVGIFLSRFLSSLISRWLLTFLKNNYFQSGYIGGSVNMETISLMLVQAVIGSVLFALTFLFARLFISLIVAAATNGNVLIKNVIPKHLESISKKLIECGAVVEEFDDAVRVSLDTRPGKCNIKTMPHPGFPTDMQPQFAVLLALAEGTSIISEGIWSNRFKYTEQLNRMGANINADGQLAVVQGVEQLKGAPVRADDLRAGAAMIIAGLAASGTTEVEDILHIDRGYENVVEKFRGLGADIKRIFCPEPDALTTAG